MDAKEAKEIIKNTPPEFNVAQPRVLYFEARAYLAALEGPEVKALVDNIERILREADDIEYDTEFDFWKALALYKEAVDEKI